MEKGKGAKWRLLFALPDLSILIVSAGRTLIIKRLNHGLTATFWRSFSLTYRGRFAANFIVSFYFATTFRALKYRHFSTLLATGISGDK